LFISRGRAPACIDSSWIIARRILLTYIQFVAGLATLQDAIQNLSTAYIKHTNAVLGDSVEGLGIDLALSKLGENPILGALAAVANAGPSGVVGDDKKERKKRQHDPNAPKRPLTPFFLYMQTARPIIANDLGPNVPKGHVSEEGTKRWKLLGPADKDVRLHSCQKPAYTY